MERYEGICCICFAPIESGEGRKILPKGRSFHRDCLNRHPTSYYAKLEYRKLKKDPQVAARESNV